MLRAAPGTVAGAGTGRRAVSASLAFRVARLAAVPVGDVVAGAYPPAGACPRCGYAEEDLDPGTGMRIIEPALSVPLT